MAEIEFTPEDLHTLVLLDFPALMRCDDVVNHVRCQDAARFSFRCKRCDEVTVFCAMHTQMWLSAMTIQCAKCEVSSGLVRDLFEVEPVT